LFVCEMLIFGVMTSFIFIMF